MPAALLPNGTKTWDRVTTTQVWQTAVINAIPMMDRTCCTVAVPNEDDELRH